MTQEKLKTGTATFNGKTLVINSVVASEFDKAELTRYLHNGWAEITHEFETDHAHFVEVEA
jgi:hypothetical protein